MKIKIDSNINFIIKSLEEEAMDMVSNKIAKEYDLSKEIVDKAIKEQNKDK